MRNITCYCCGDDCFLWAEKTNSLGNFKLYKCQNCRSTFVHPRPDLLYLTNFYKDKYDSSKQNNFKNIVDSEIKFPNSTVDARRIISKVKKIKNISLHTGNSFLDVGAGYGFFSKEAIENGFNVTCIEIGEFERLCIKELIGVPAIASTFEDFENGDQTYDVILMSQMLEHVIDPINWIRKSKHLLRENGVIIIAVPNFNSLFRYLLGKNDIFIIPPEHLNFFTKKGLMELLHGNGFTVRHYDYVSRLQFSTRINSFILSSFVHYSEKIFCKFLDLMHLGMFINIYASKN